MLGAWPKLKIHQCVTFLCSTRERIWPWLAEAKPHLTAYNRCLSHIQCQNSSIRPLTNSWLIEISRKYQTLQNHKKSKISQRVPCNSTICASKVASKRLMKLTFIRNWNVLQIECKNSIWNNISDWWKSKVTYILSTVCEIILIPGGGK
jgi:hypothetical protein